MARLLAANRIAVDWKDIDSRVNHVKPKSSSIRSSGVHLSGVLKAVLIATGELKPTEQTEEEMPLRMVLGMAFEEYVVGFWPDLVWQPGEICLDDVYLSPDGISPELGQVEEFKCTWRSAFNFDILQYKRWMWQLMGYCKALGLLRARLHSLFVNGDYRPSAPIYMTYLIEFTQTELDSFWTNLVLNNKHNASAEKH